MGHNSRFGLLFLSEVSHAWYIMVCAGERTVQTVIYYIKLNLSVCPFVLYTNPQFWADRCKTWHEASLGHWAEQGQVGDSAQGEQPAPAGCEPVLVHK